MNTASVAHLTALAFSAGAGVVIGLTLRIGAAVVRSRPAADRQAWRRVHQQRLKAFTDFAESADQIGTIVSLWPSLPADARREKQDQAHAHLRELEQSMTAVMLDSSPPVRAAAQALLGKATRLVHALDAGTGLAREIMATSARPPRLSLPFLTVCREWLDQEAARSFDLRRRSLFAR
ncbi:hypothetical protein QJ054_33515 [Streptomyces sp. AN-3]|uniref:hypothetical protein n=1 Tax=Streptomyces sp. AN-3 TaxID=3044177 RepID=UPI00249CA5D3|nr:hypothetical protein [Streptomyces sp. AN-3]MDI3101955.1 hypothetical protein [Streptomyces sp. AN-3]